jgi:hypothetical protein
MGVDTLLKKISELSSVEPCYINWRGLERVGNWDSFLQHTAITAHESAHALVLYLQSESVHSFLSHIGVLVGGCLVCKRIICCTGSGLTEAL